MSDEEVVRSRLAAYRAFGVVSQDPHALLDVVWGAADEADARARLMARYGIGDEAARAVLNMQVLRFTEQARGRIADDLREVEERARADGLTE